MEKNKLHRVTVENWDLLRKGVCISYELELFCNVLGFFPL